MNSVTKIIFEKNDAGEFFVRLSDGEATVSYTITSSADVQDVIYLLPYCLSADLAGKGLEMGPEVCEVECGAGCENMSKLSAAQASAIFRVLASGDNPCDLDVMVQAIQACF